MHLRPEELKQVIKTVEEEIEEKYVDVGSEKPSEVKPKKQYRVLWMARNINKLLTPSVTVLPDANDMLLTFSKPMKCYSSCDMTSFYYQVGVDEKYGDFFNAVTVLGIYRAERMCQGCLLYTSPSPRDKRQSRMPSSA